MTTLLDKQRAATSKVQGPGQITSDQMHSRIAALAPMITRLAPDIEQGRRLPAELVSALRSARIYGMLVPRCYGGLELDALSASRVGSGTQGWRLLGVEYKSRLAVLQACCMEHFGKCRNARKSRENWGKALQHELSVAPHPADR